MTVRNKIISKRRLLVANRGEIAIRIFRAASELNMTTVGIYSYEDRFAMHRFKADEAFCLGQPGKPLEAYLDWEQIIAFAKSKNVDAIHAGYGFLSENSQFAQACEDADIMFCGPSAKVLDMFGDKVKARQVAKGLGIPVIPGTDQPVANIEQALSFAQNFGYPVVLKAVAGGGGKGIRKVRSDDELRKSFNLASSEALSSFGRADVYIEKAIEQPKHIEVQIVGDYLNHVIHLYDRDCSIQRRNQKIIEVAPAFSVPPATREKLYEYAVHIGKSSHYVGVGTVEFLIDQEGRPYFLEVNPRIQVEHTVTEMVTNFDIVQASIMLAAGRELSHPAMSVRGQEDIKARGVAVQCRITTEDPSRDFAPDVGKILAYRPAQGFGIRLDEGLATQGGLVTPHYDSLLVKVTAHAVDMLGASNKMHRALSEFRIRGVRTNIPLLRNVIRHPAFIDGSFTTGFLEENLGVFSFPEPQDRATKILRFLADVIINNPHQISVKAKPALVQPRLQVPEEIKAVPGTKDILREKGVAGLIKMLRSSEALWLTDTTMRDAHQSLFATRLRTKDILGAVDYYRIRTAGFFSLEVWGGATFDTTLRFLKEDPWERLALVREKVPNVLLQMLLRGDNAVGYTNYPEWVVRDFIRLTVESGLDVFRVFDCLNNPEQMEVAMDEVKKRGAVLEACICYTGNIVDPTRTKYSLRYYTDLATRLVSMGTDILCIKDMAGLLRPDAARALINALKQQTDIPIHLHTHATSGNAEAMLLEAARAGCEIVDGAVSSMSGLTSQPSLNAIVAALEFDKKKPAVGLRELDELSVYWEGVRSMYAAFETNVRSTTTRVYEHEIPGGQYSNLFDQARQVGVSPEEFEEITERYKEVNSIFGDIIKVTPSSKVVGDMALLLHKNKLHADEWLRKDIRLDYPDSVISFFKGHMGIPLGGFPQDVRAKILGEQAPPPEKIVVTGSDSLESARAELNAITKRPNHDRDVLSFRLYPKVFKDAFVHKQQFGNVDRLPTTAFFYGLQTGEEVAVDLEKGKTLYISLSGVSNPDERGVRKVFFELNGFPREIEVVDQAKINRSLIRTKADLLNNRHVGAPMPGKVSAVKVTLGERVDSGTVLLVLEAMKMEYAVTAKEAGVVSALNVQAGDRVEEGDLLVSL